jgi:hypothetical protein
MLKEEYELYPLNLRSWVSSELKYDYFEEWKSEGLTATYQKERKRFQDQGKLINEQILFHGCPKPGGINGIRTRGFDLSKLGSSSHDRGFFGAGIYFSTSPAGASFYAKLNSQPDKAYQTCKLIVSRVLVGKSFQIQPDLIGKLPYLGAGLKAGYDSHTAINEVVIFDTVRILPLGLLHLQVDIPPRRVVKKYSSKKNESKLLDILSIQEGIFSLTEKLLCLDDTGNLKLFQGDKLLKYFKLSSSIIWVTPLSLNKVLLIPLIGDDLLLLDINTGLSKNLALPDLTSSEKPIKAFLLAGSYLALVSFTLNVTIWNLERRKKRKMAVKRRVKRVEGAYYVKIGEDISLGWKVPRKTPTQIHLLGEKDLTPEKGKEGTFILPNFEKGRILGHLLKRSWGDSLAQSYIPEVLSFF